MKVFKAFTEPFILKLIFILIQLSEMHGTERVKYMLPYRIRVSGAIVIGAGGRFLHAAVNLCVEA